MTSMNIHRVEKLKIEDLKVESSAYEEGYFYVKRLVIKNDEGEFQIDLMSNNHCPHSYENNTHRYYGEAVDVGEEG
tara:strand:- start:290 stop:517 length:228 start_codon:yes stop_codon:yes gene_type:complete